MAYEMLVGDRALFVVWGRPEIEDFMSISEEIRRTSEPGVGRTTFITRVPPTAEVPTRQVQKVMNEQLGTIVDRLSTYHVVLEGKGFAAATKRSVLALMFLTAGRRGLFFVHSRADEVLARVKPEARLDVATLLSTASTLGMLDSGPPATSRTYRAEPTAAA